MSILLQHPHLILGEGPQGLSLRVANSNGLTTLSLKSLGFFFDAKLLKTFGCLPDESSSTPLIAHATHVARQWADSQKLWNVGHGRCCPACLSESAHWRIGWELFFFDVCPEHGCWLIDHCDRCGSSINWRRQDLLQCDCGHKYACSKVREAPAANVLLAQDLQVKFSDQNAPCNLTPMLGLNFGQATQLIRFLGTYSQNQISRLPQKVQNLGSMDVSWQITSTAAEILHHWPEKFEHVLHGMLAQSSGTVGQRFPARFGFFYSLLYRRFGDPEFTQLRTAFENFVAQHWHGPIAKRNTRLARAMQQRATWVPANYARRHLQVSSSRLAELVRSGALLGEERLSEKGRRFLVVQKESMLAMRPALDDEVDLVTACEILGLTRARLRSALPLLFPNARKIEGDANRWAISRSEVESLMRICDVPAISKSDDGQVTLDHILRFWCCSEDEIASLLLNLRGGVLQPIGRLGPDMGLNRLVFLEVQVRQLVNIGRVKDRDKWTIPQVAEMLDVKQEVAYFLVRQGLLASTTEVIGRRESALVTREGLNAFRSRYVFARDLAKLHKTSSRSLQSRLAEINIHPVVSPMLGACRQVIYERTPTLKELFPAMAQIQSVVH